MITKYTILTVALLAGAVGASRFHSGPAGDDINYETMGKDVETMRRVLDKELRNTKSAKRQGADVMYFDSHGSSDAYYAAGSGFVYVGSVDAVFVGSNKPEETPKEPKERSLWEEVQAEMDGTNSMFTGTYTLRGMAVRNAKYDPKIADDIQERAIRTMGKYASKIGQLKDHDKITIILRGSNARVLTTTARVEEPDDKDKKGDVSEKSEKAADVLVSSVRAFGGSGSGTVMTLSASVDDCASFAAGKTDFDTFAGKVKVARYINSSGKSGYAYSIFEGK